MKVRDEKRELKETYTKTEIDNLLKNITIDTSKIYNDIFPIGRVFIDENVDAEGNGIDYSNYLGFTWEKTLKGVSPIGINEEDTDFSTMANSGGEKTHQLTVEELPKISGQFSVSNTLIASHNNYDLVGADGNIFKITKSTEAIRTNSNPTSETKTYARTINFNVGGNTEHNIMSPYKVVAFWKRIA